MSTELGHPGDLLEGHPETAYFWGRVVGDGDLADGTVTVRATDETAARRLAAIAGAQQVDHRIVERDYAHHADVTRTEDEYEVTIEGDLADRAAAALGLPIEGGRDATGHRDGERDAAQSRDGDGDSYRLDGFRDHSRQFLRGLLEGCATVCFKSDARVVGLSFVHADRRALEATRDLLDSIPPAAACDDLAETSSGYYFSVADGDVPALGEWLYEGIDETGLFDPGRKRKLLRSIEQAEDP